MSLAPSPADATPAKAPSAARPPPGWRTPLALAGATLALLAAAWLFSPWWAAWRLVQDARGADVAAVARRIDLPLVRESLTPQIEARVRARIAHEQARPHDIWGRLALMLAPAVAAPVVQVAVTPATVAEAIRHVRAPVPALPGAPGPPAPAGPGDPRPVAMGYAGQGLDRDWDGFDVVLASRAAPPRRLGLHLLRRGLFGWRLVAVDLPEPG